MLYRLSVSNRLGQLHCHAASRHLEPELISNESKRKIMWQNALDFYRFPEEMLPSEFIEATELQAS